MPIWGNGTDLGPMWTENGFNFFQIKIKNMCFYHVALDTR